MAKQRRVQCSGKVVRGQWKGARCERLKLMPVDKNDNTRQWRCVSHAGQKRR